MSYPPWIREALQEGQNYCQTPAARRLERQLDSLRLATVCRSARCPNQGWCWSQGTATFLLLGKICTRACSFCNLRPGRPEPVDEDEPWRLLQAVRALGLRRVVLTSVTRDDLADGGAAAYAEAIRVLRRGAGPLQVEILTPDFQGRLAALETLAAAQPEVWGHNVETVPRLYARVRPGADYRRSLAVLAAIKRLLPAAAVKSGLMLGVGETTAEVQAVLADLRQAGVDQVTLGQYLPPSRRHLPLSRYASPEEFAQWGRLALAMGFSVVHSGPLVRSSLPASESQSAPAVTPAGGNIVPRFTVLTKEHSSTCTGK